MYVGCVYVCKIYGSEGKIFIGWLEEKNADGTVRCGKTCNDVYQNKRSNWLDGKFSKPIAVSKSKHNVQWICWVYALCIIEHAEER